MKLSAAVQELMVLADLSEAEARTELLRRLRSMPGWISKARRVYRRQGETLVFTDNEVLLAPTWQLVKVDWEADALYRDEALAAANEAPAPCGRIVKAEGVEIFEKDIGKLAEDLRKAAAIRAWVEKIEAREAHREMPGDHAVQEPARGKRGAKQAYPWDAYEEVFKRRVADEGYPDANNVDGWQTQSDVARWIQDLADSDPAVGKAPSWSTAKSYAGEWMTRCRGQ